MARALLTDGEREALTNDEMDQNSRSTHISRIKKKLSLLGEDARILREHAPDLYGQAREEFCEEELDERVQRLEQEIEELRAELDEDGE
jgi:hypothetical protein